DRLVDDGNAYRDWIPCTVQRAFHVNLTESCRPVDDMLPLRLARLDGRYQHIAATICGDEFDPPFPHPVGRKAADGPRKIRAKLVSDRRGERSEYFGHSDLKNPA